jgi:ornithine carbamoyltransferase
MHLKGLPTNDSYLEANDQYRLAHSNDSLNGWPVTSGICMRREARFPIHAILMQCIIQFPFQHTATTQSLERRIRDDVINKQESSSYTDAYTKCHTWQAVEDYSQDTVTQKLGCQEK